MQAERSLEIKVRIGVALHFLVREHDLLDIRVHEEVEGVDVLLNAEQHAKSVGARKRARAHLDQTAHFQKCRQQLPLVFERGNWLCKRLAVDAREQLVDPDLRWVRLQNSELCDLRTFGIFC